MTTSTKTETTRSGGAKAANSRTKSSGRPIHPAVLFAVLLAAFLAVWEAAVRVGLTSSLMPPPSLVFTELVAALSNPFYIASANDAGIGIQLGTSLLRVLIGFGLAMVVALPLGVFLGTSPNLSKAVDPFVQVLRPVSPLAWLPIGLALLRDSQQTAIFVIFISAIWPMLLNTIAATNSVPKTYLEVARTLKASRWTTMRRIIIPAALPNILTGLRVSMGVAWLVIIAAEMLIGGRGIGYFIWNQWNNLDIANIIVAILLVGLVGIMLDRAFALLERRFAYDG
ncbi:MAG: nitrate ABC transporter permease [Actinomycetota bacterium]|nr:nitrate ABC transporter permease [Actinomycetota bacterium]